MVMQGITDTNNQFIAAVRRGDAAGCAAVYTEDAQTLPPDSPKLSGKQAAQELWQAMINMGLRDLTMRTLHLEEHGDTALEMGAGTLDIRPEGGQPIKVEAKWIVLWKRQADGSWKWHWDCFNTDSPLG